MLAILPGPLCLVCLVIFIHTLVEKCLKNPQENTSNHTEPPEQGHRLSLSHITTEHIIGPFSITLVLFMILMHFEVDKYLVPTRFYLLIRDLHPLLRGSAVLTSYIYYRNPHLRSFVKDIIFGKQDSQKASNEIQLEIM